MLYKQTRKYMPLGYKISFTAHRSIFESATSTPTIFYKMQIKFQRGVAQQSLPAHLIEDGVVLANALLQLLHHRVHHELQK
jgi:hypothetical protein